EVPVVSQKLNSRSFTRTSNSHFARKPRPCERLFKQPAGKQSDGPRGGGSPFAAARFCRRQRRRLLEAVGVVQRSPLSPLPLADGWYWRGCRGCAEPGDAQGSRKASLQRSSDPEREGLAQQADYEFVHRRSSREEEAVSANGEH